MFRGRAVAVCALAALAVLAVVMVAGPALAKKPPKPPPDPGPPADPAITYVRFNRHKGSDLMVMNADGSNQTMILQGPKAKPPGIEHHSPSWGPNGNRIVFESNMPDPGKGIYVIDKDGSNLVRIAPLNTKAQVTVFACPAWSPQPLSDGEHRIVYCDLPPDHGGRDVYDLYVMKPDGSDRKVLIDREVVEDCVDVSWSPDADRLLVETIAPLQLLVYAVSCDPETGDESATLVKNLIPADSPLSGAWIRGSEWSKTGDRVALHARGGGTGSTVDEVWIIDLSDPSNPTRVIAGTNPAWSSDDSRLAIQSGGIRSVTTGGGDPVQLATEGIMPAWRR